MIALDRLQQIIPADQALANKSLSVALAQINGISTTTLPAFAAAVAATETTKDLPLISALTEAVPPSVADYYASTLAVGSGSNGTIQTVDIIGLAGGWVATDAFVQTTQLFSTMDLTYLTLIYQTMTNVYNGTYGDPQLGPVVIPLGLPAAGTYNAVTQPNPSPPPADIVTQTAASVAFSALNPLVIAEVANLVSKYPDQTNQLNTLFTDMALQINSEITLQPLVNLNYANLRANDSNSVYGFVQSLPDLGLQTQVGGMAWFLEAMADLSNLGGEAVIACLRQGRNQAALSAANLYTNTKIPADPVPPPPRANLLPSVYSESEASNLVIK
jgi:hypothetical protein